MHILLKFMFTLLLTMSIPMSLQAQSRNINSYYRLKELNESFGKINYQHIFTYDDQGRPLTHKYDYFKNNKLNSSGTYKYTYDHTGKLTSKNSDKLQYNYFYKNNTLNKIILKIIDKNKWELLEEALISETQTGNQKTMHLIINKRKLVNGQLDSLKNYCDIEYIMDNTNNILKSTTYAYNYSLLKEPITYTYDYDNKTNPLQNIFIERWYQFDIENGGLTNVLNIKGTKGNKTFTSNKIYEYNDAGYPIKCITNNYKLKTFKYELAELPLPKQTIQETITMQKQSMIIYPNPTTINFMVKADGLSQGQAVLRVLELSTGKILKQATYNVENNLEALITTNGMPSGLYIIEIVNNNIILKEKLIVQ